MIGQIILLFSVNYGPVIMGMVLVIKRITSFSQIRLNALAIDIVVKGILSPVN